MLSKRPAVAPFTFIRTQLTHSHFIYSHTLKTQCIKKNDFANRHATTTTKKRPSDRLFDGARVLAAGERDLAGGGRQLGSARHQVGAAARGRDPRGGRAQSARAGRRATQAAHAAAGRDGEARQANRPGHHWTPRRQRHRSGQCLFPPTIPLTTQLLPFSILRQTLFFSSRRANLRRFFLLYLYTFFTQSVSLFVS
jgi:hypothetical protein